MNNYEESRRAEHAKTQPGGTGKKLYHKPAFRHERVFETRALTCGKIQNTEGPCHSNRKTS